MSPLVLIGLAWLLSKIGKSNDGKGGTVVDLTPRAEPASVPPIPGTTRPAVVPAATTATAPVIARSAPEPWPQVVPAGVPAFPGPDWEPDTPISPGVSTRAAQLLTTLWRSGPGTKKTEQTAGKWITYVAVQMGTKRGVTAYRLRADHGEPAVDPISRPVPRTTTAAYRPEAPSAEPVRALPASQPPEPSPTALPTLRRGSAGPEVSLLQSKLGGLQVDGKFGPATEARVREYQRSAGLQVDGVVGRQTWGALFARAA